MFIKIISKQNYIVRLKRFDFYFVIRDPPSKKKKRIAKEKRLSLIMLIPPPLHAYPHDLVRVHIYTRLPEDEYLIAPSRNHFQKKTAQISKVGSKTCDTRSMSRGSKITSNGPTKNTLFEVF